MPLVFLPGFWLSLAIQEAIDSPNASFYFFYSAEPAEPERTSFELTLCHLVKQDLSGCMGCELRKIPRYVVRPYKDSESDGFATGSLTANECYNQSTPLTTER